MRFGPFVRTQRIERGITLRDFARRLSVSPTYVSQVERENFSPPAEPCVRRIARILEVDEDELLALAGRVADDLPEIIRSQPRVMAAFLRTAHGLSSQDLQQLVVQAQSLKNRHRDPS
ncbi:MAG: helix-turn-helix transcriptional regulator [Planctomycetales bacterium]|nr:helix-turn-helix transcriptional regulator [Planctomycetales bacterium]